MDAGKIPEIRAMPDAATVKNTGIASTTTLELLKGWLRDDQGYQLEIIMVPMYAPVPVLPGKRYLFSSTILIHPFS
ncbi:hypothetical protein C8R46DRAFT_1229712 [Mycena filopes]|nr:hypothetical protein C8R46DRAFT_1229712 [Mycena filopes]